MSNAVIDMIRGRDIRVWALLEAVDEGDFQEVQRLVGVEGVPVGAGHNFYGWTPLLYAAMGGHIPIMAWLLSNGSSLVEEDMWGKNAMHHAIEHNQIHALRFLLEVEGASIRGCDRRVNNNNEVLILSFWCWIAKNFKPAQFALQDGVPGILPNDLESLLKVMVMHEDAPLDFRHGLAQRFLTICDLGRLYRPKLLYYLEQQRVAIREGLLMSVGVLEQMVAEYARTTPEDMWATGLPVVPFWQPVTRLTRVVQKRGLEEGGSVSPALRRSQRLRNISKSD
jgi:hypothetical protein